MLTYELIKQLGSNLSPAGYSFGLTNQSRLSCSYFDIILSPFLKKFTSSSNNRYVSFLNDNCIFLAYSVEPTNEWSALPSIPCFFK